MYIKVFKNLWSICLSLVILFTVLFSLPAFEAKADELMWAVEYQLLVNGEPVTAYVQVPADNTANTEYIPEGEEYREDTEPGQITMVSVEKELTLGAYENGENHQIFLSLRDLAAALNGTAKQFDIQMDYEMDAFAITTGMAYQFPEPVLVPVDEPWLNEGDYYDRDGNIRDAQDQIIWTPEDKQLLVRPQSEYLSLYLNPLMLDGMEVRYYTYQLSSLQDLYMNIIDVQLMLGITIEKTDAGILNVYTDRGFAVDLDAFASDGYFDLFNGVVLGDATTGEILFGCKENNPDAIASTSKLMTFMIVARYLELGKIGLDDIVTISANTEALSKGPYGVIWMDAGQQVTVRDLLGAMLLISSNEAALALGEYVAGSEEAFVFLMNEMAGVLGLDSAKFFNPHGLPDYSDSVIASTRQNYMSVADLFRLSAAVLKKYPKITEYTAQKTMYLESFDYLASNTNYLLYNMSNAIGLKTGTTDEAGCCLVGAINAPAPDGNHILVAIVIGALSNYDRYQIPEVLLTWGMNQISSIPKATITPGK